MADFGSIREQYDASRAIREVQERFWRSNLYVSELTVHPPLEEGVPTSQQLSNFPLNLPPKVESWKVKWKVDTSDESGEGLIITSVAQNTQKGTDLVGNLLPTSYR